LGASLANLTDDIREYIGFLELSGCVGVFLKPALNQLTETFVPYMIKCFTATCEKEDGKVSHCGNTTFNKGNFNVRPPVEERSKVSNVHNKAKGHES
jgi:hypothetical protein